MRGKAGKLSWGLAGLAISSLFPNILGALTQPRDKIPFSRWLTGHWLGKENLLSLTLIRDLCVGMLAYGSAILVALLYPAERESMALPLQNRTKPSACQCATAMILV